MINENPGEIREKFFNFLLKKPCSSGDAEEYLSKHGVPEEYKNLFLTQASNLGLIDDAAYAKLFVEGHLTGGNAKIIYELARRGFSRDEIDTALDESEDEISRACELAEDWRKIGLDERKIMNRLLSRGFSRSSVNEAKKQESGTKFPNSCF